MIEEMNMKNAIFIHCGNLLVDKFSKPNKFRCQNIINEIADYITSSGILDSIDSINLEIVGDPNIEMSLPKTKINFNGNNVHQWEFPTIEKIIKFAEENPDYNILYLHTKGSSMSITDANAKYHDDVRNYHLYWTLTHYKECLDLLKKHDVVGAELQQVPVRHYSHNMWWSKASHINKLNHPLEYPMVYDERHQAEFWIGRDETSKYCSIFNLYDNHIHAVSYEKHLYR
jgi:hypothetical protein